MYKLLRLVLSINEIKTELLFACTVLITKIIVGKNSNFIIPPPVYAHAKITANNKSHFSIARQSKPSKIKRYVKGEKRKTSDFSRRFVC